MQRNCKGPADISSGRAGALAGTVAVAVAAVYSWIAAGFHPFTWPMRIAVAVPMLVAAAYAVRPDLPSSDTVLGRTAAFRVSVAVWIGLLVLATAWELAALFSSPRDDHPTLSSIGDDVMRTHPGRALTFAMWLVVGWLLFVRPRMERQP